MKIIIFKNIFVKNIVKVSMQNKQIKIIKHVYKIAYIIVKIPQIIVQKIVINNHYIQFKTPTYVLKIVNNLMKHTLQMKI